MNLWYNIAKERSRVVTLKAVKSLHLFFIEGFSKFLVH